MSKNISPVMENWPSQMVNCLNLYQTMKLELHRMMTCIDLTDGTWLNAIRDGFFRFGNSDYLQCFCCGLQVPIDLLHKDVVSYHASFSPKCSFVLKREPNLILRIDTPGIHRYGDPKILADRDAEVATLQPISSITQAEEDQVIQIYSEKKTLNPEKVFQLYQLRVNRVFSFKKCSLSIKFKNWFVESGFFWTGSNRIVQCAFCRLAVDGQLKNHPSETHSLLSPDCPYANEERFIVERHLCCVCLVQTHQMLYLPCNHLAVCVSCDNTLSRLGQENCPVCRTSIDGRIKVIKP